MFEKEDIYNEVLSGWLWENPWLTEEQIKKNPDFKEEVEDLMNELEGEQNYDEFQKRT